MAKPKPITRQGPGGGVIADQSEPLTSDEVLNYAKMLGQTFEQAKETLALYESEQLSASDVKELYDMRKDVEAAKKVEQYLKRREVPQSFNVGAAGINPRDPSRIKQKVAVRDPITGIREKLPFEPEDLNG